MAVRCDGGRFLHTREEILQSAAAWDDLDSSVAPIGGEAWTRAWFATFAAEYSPEVLVAGPTDAPDAVLPLVRRRRKPWFLETLGMADIGEVTDGMFRNPAWADPLARALVDRRLPVRLRRLPAASALVPALHRAATRTTRVLARPVTGTPMIDLDETWVEPESHFSSKRRQDFRAARRRLAARGEVQFSVEIPKTRDEAHDLLDEFVAVEGAGWKTAQGTSLAMQPRQRAFFREFCELAAEQGILRFGVLRVDGKAAAGQLAAECAGRFSLFKIGYDGSFARCSPGTLLMLHSIAWSAQRELRSYDLLGWYEPWTEMWSTSVRECVEMHVYPMRPIGAAAASATAVELARRTVRQRRSRAANAPGKLGAS